MADGQETNFKRPQCHLIWPSAHDRHRIGGHPVLFQFATGNIGGKCAAVNWRAQTGIGMANGSNMIFMRMGNEHAINTVFACL